MQPRTIYDIKGWCSKYNNDIGKLLHNSTFTFYIKIFDHVTMFWKQQIFMIASQKIRHDNFKDVMHFVN